MQARLLNTAPEKAEADALILPIFEGQSMVPAEAVALDKKLKGAITQLLADDEFRGKFMELVPLHNLGNAPSKWTVLLGLGKPAELDLVRLRNALQAAGRVLRKRGPPRAPTTSHGPPQRASGSATSTPAPSRRGRSKPSPKSTP